VTDAGGHAGTADTVPDVMVTADARPERSRRGIVGLAVAAVLVVAAVTVWRNVVQSSGSSPVLTLSGRIEGDDAAVGARTAGRMVEVRVQEGDKVSAGDVLAVLDDDQVRARVVQARAALAEAEARATAARNQISVLEQQLRHSGLQADQARVDAEGRVRQAEADLATAEAQLAREQAALQIAEFDKDAYTQLAKSGAVSERQGRQAVSAAEQQSAAVAAAQRGVEAARAGVATAGANLTTPEIRAAEGAAIQRQIGQQQAEIASALAQIEQARAQLSEAEANRDDLTVKAPFDGTIVTRVAEPGEVVVPGTPIVTLVDLTRVYLRGFIPEGRIGEVKVGQPARVYLDSDPDKPIEAYVSRIDPEATFTPENTYFREDRVKQVVGVKVVLKGAAVFAKPGMPADGEILVGEAWQSDKRH
jgi:HlyD family secretion protein